MQQNVTAGHPVLPPANPRILVVGVGHAGSNILRRIVGDGGNPVQLVCMDTDEGTLGGSVAATRVQLGRNLTCGLNAGGDPEVGREAALESEEEIRSVFHGADLVFLCTGLGGGTASGATPVIARIAREAGCFVLVFVTLPFQFEGQRRKQQAQEALAKIRPHAGALLTFENDRLGQLIVPTKGVQKAFEVADTTICHSIRAITTMLEKPGVMQVDRAKLFSLLNGQDARCLFGFGKATGPDRALAALRAALENPLLGEGDLLSSATTVLVHLSGDRNVTLVEVQQVMDEVRGKVVPPTEPIFGVSATDELGDELWVAVISSVARGSYNGMMHTAPVAVRAYTGFSASSAAVSPPTPAPAPVVTRPIVSPPTAPVTAAQPQPAPLAGPGSGPPRDRPPVEPLKPPMTPTRAPFAPPVARPEPSGASTPTGPPLVAPTTHKPMPRPPLRSPAPVGNPAPRPAPAPVAHRPLINPDLLGETEADAKSPSAPVNGASRTLPAPTPIPSVLGVNVTYPAAQDSNGKPGTPIITLDSPRPSFEGREALPGQAPAQEAREIPRGRFVQAEPTIIEGQDMDVPTFLRRLRRSQ